MHAFAFTRRNISCQTLYQLKNRKIDHRYLLWGEVSIDLYTKQLLHDQPDYILGLGRYGGRDKDKIKIERTCSNQFGKRLLGNDNYEELEINSFLKPGKLSIYSKSIKTSYCNLVSWKIMSLIKENKLKAKYCFLHIPTTFKLHETVGEIEEMIYDHFEQKL